MAGIERVGPQSGVFETLAKAHFSWKISGSAEAHINVLLVVVPDCPEEGPFLHWVWVIEVIRNEVVDDISARRFTAVIGGMVKTE